MSSKGLDSFCGLILPSVYSTPLFMSIMLLEIGANLSATDEFKIGWTAIVATNDEVILREILESSRANTAPQLPASEFFELFVAEQTLKSFDLSNDEIESGITGNGGDGGIDSMYTFVNGKIVAEDTTDFSGYKKGVRIDLFIIQSKTSSSFSGTVIDRFIEVTKDILNLSNPLSDLTSVYNAKLIQSASDFRRVHLALVSKFPQLHIRYVYASLGDTEQIHPNVRRKEKALKETVYSLFSHCECEFSFFGSNELLQLVRKAPSNSIQVNLEYAISTRKQAYLCLVNIKEYYNFICDEDGNLRRNIFDANVRDYGGVTVEVNKGIRETLQQETPEDFWWLNNGITIIAARGTIVSQTITLEDPQIVNGLQTSTEIYNYFKDHPKTFDERSIMVKIIVTDDSSSQAKIIRATNSQTAIHLASLRATDKIQRDIEDFFLGRDLYYDRRKNYYKNQGYPREKIISIPYLAQAIMAIVLQQPDQARARPSSILKPDPDYKKVFNPSYPMTLYLNCVNIMRRVDDYIKSGKTVLSSEEKNNLRFHIAMCIAIAKLKRTDYKPGDIAGMDVSSISDEFLLDCIKDVVTMFNYNVTSTMPNQLPDTVGKSKDFVISLLNHYRHVLDQPRRNQ